MKRLLFLILCAAVLFSCVGCGTGEPKLTVKGGGYYLVGDYEEFSTPYLWLNTENQTFHLCAGAVFSYAERGEYEIKGNQLIAVSQNTIYIFEIQDENTLIIRENGESWAFQPPVNGEFRYSEDVK